MVWGNINQANHSVCPAMEVTDWSMQGQKGGPPLQYGEPREMSALVKCVSARDRAWMSKLHSLMAWKKQNAGAQPRLKAKDRAEEGLALWVRKQQSAYKILKSDYIEAIYNALLCFELLIPSFLL